MNSLYDESEYQWDGDDWIHQQFCNSMQKFHGVSSFPRYSVSHTEYRGRPPDFILFLLLSLPLSPFLPSSPAASS